VTLELENGLAGAVAEPSDLRVIGIAERVVAPVVDGDVRQRWWRDKRRRRALAFADLVTAVLVGTALSAAYEWSLIPLALIPAWLLAAKLMGLYDRDHRAVRHQTMDELSTLAAWSAVSVLISLLALSTSHATTITVGTVIAPWLVAFAAAALLRAVGRWAWRRATPPERTLVIGTGRLADGISRKIELFPDMHMTLEGREPIDVSGDYGTVMRTIDNVSHELDRIIVAITVMEPGMVDHLSSICRRHGVKLSVLSPLRGRTGPMPRISQVADLPVLECNTWDVPRSTGVIKRAFDLAVAGAALLVLAPLLPLVAAAIRLESRGPVIYRQRRVGRKGTSFWILKLRTMYADAEARLPELVSFDTLEDPMFKLRADPRITRVGRLLRRFSIDELPQLVNVVRGEMSVVGPRPEQVELVDRYRPEHRFRLSVKPGMTGPMQVFGRGELTFAERLAVELDYVENISPSRDLKILVQTLPVIARGTGAF